MIINFASRDKLNIKSKNSTITLDKKIVIDDFSINGPGEYDVDGIQIEAQPLKAGLASFVYVEDMVITHITSLEQELTKIKGVSDTNILIVDLKSNDTVDKLKPIIKSLEPSYIYLLGAGKTAEFIAQLGIITEKCKSLKVTLSALPESGTTLIEEE